MDEETIRAAVAEPYLLVEDCSQEWSDCALLFDHDRLQAECDTKRRIIAECKYWYDKVNRQEDYPALADRFEVAFGILRLLGLPYQDRPGLPC